MVGPFPYGDGAGRRGLGVSWWELPPFSILPALRWGRLLVPGHLPPCALSQMQRGIGALPWDVASYEDISSRQLPIAAGGWDGSWGL